MFRMKRQPGPWHLLHDGRGYWEIHPEDPDAVEARGETPICMFEGLAHVKDARLASAAPEMLAALEAMVVFQSGPQDSSQEWLDVMRAATAAINKATGKSDG